MQALYFDDFEPGQQFRSKGATLSESQIMDFALTYDPQPFHIDKVAAEEGPFGGLIASGFQTLSLAFRLFYQANVINTCSMGSPGFDKLRWLRPVRPSDTLTAAAEVKEMRPSSSKPDRGTLLMDYTVTNQNAEPVMTFTAIHILARKA